MSLDDAAGGSSPSIQSSKTQVGSSGHSSCRKLRFSATLASIFTGMSVVTPAKDFYLEKFGANPLAMGVLFFIVSFLTPMGEMFSGKMQNREALRYFFPIDRWGRKAPWLLTSCMVLSVTCALMYIPPEGNAFVLHGWFLVMSIILYAACSTMLIAFESARQEIYPYNEERSSVELWCKISCTVGIGFALLPMLVLLANAAFYLRLAVSIAWLVGVSVFGLQACPIWLEANSTSKQEEETQRMLSMLREAWQTVAFRHLCLVRWFDGMYQGIQATNLFYYLTYVLQMHGLSRSVYIGVMGIGSIGGEMLSAVLVTKWLKKREFSFGLQNFVIRARIMNCITTVFLLVLPILMFGYGVLDDDSDLAVVRGIFLLWMTVTRVFQSPYTFWRVGAQCWVIDEDIHHAGPGGVRREAAIVAVASAAQNFARALSSAVVFLGYGIAGLNQNDCMSACKDVPSQIVNGLANKYVWDTEVATDEECRDACYEWSKIDQPDSLRIYIRCCFLIGLTLVEILLVVHTHLFPIRGIRLAKLYNNQTLSLGGKISGDSTKAEQKKLDRANTGSMQRMMDSAPGDSKVMLLNYDVSAGIAQVAQLISQQRKSAKPAQIPKVSISCVLTLPDAASEDSHRHTNGVVLQEAVTSNGFSKVASPQCGKDKDLGINGCDEGFGRERSHLDARARFRPRTPIAVQALSGDTRPVCESPRSSRGEAEVE